MALKKGIAKVDNKEVEQYVLENDRDVHNFFREKGSSMLDSLKQRFLKHVSKGEVIMLNTYANFMGFYSWRTSDDYWKLIKVL